jgi:uncharacterized protein with FMN-binding domain
MRRVALAIVSTAAVLVMILSFKTHGTSSATTTPPAAITSTGTESGSTSSTPTPTASSKSSSSSSATSTRTVTGTAADTRYGPVQVRVTVTNGKLTAVSAVDYPSGSSRDAQINSYAIPALNREALAANSPNIDMISGATFTSEGYITSLQSALDQAKS